MNNKDLQLENKKLKKEIIKLNKKIKLLEEENNLLNKKIINLEKEKNKQEEEYELKELQNSLYDFEYINDFFDIPGSNCDVCIRNIFCDEFEKKFNKKKKDLINFYKIYFLDKKYKNNSNYINFVNNELKNLNNIKNLTLEYFKQNYDLKYYKFIKYYYNYYKYFIEKDEYFFDNEKEFKDDVEDYDDFNIDKITFLKFFNNDKDELYSFICVNEYNLKDMYKLLDLDDFGEETEYYYDDMVEVIDYLIKYYRNNKCNLIFNKLHKKLDEYLNNNYDKIYKINDKNNDDKDD